MAAVNFCKVTKTYTSAKESGGVFDLSFDIPEGTFTTLLGHSGSGKTTTLRLLAGFLRPDKGEVKLAGKTVADHRTFLPTNRRDLAMVFQSYALWPHMTVFDNVAFGLKIKRIPKLEIRERVDEALRLVDIQDYAARRPGELSGGQQQRVALARSLVLKPKLLLLDEPLSNLDAELRAQMREQLKELQRTTGITFVYVTHDQEEAMALSDVMAVMDRGRVLQIGPPEELYFQPNDVRVAQFLSRGGGLLQGVVGGIDEEQVVVDLPGHETQVSGRRPKRTPSPGDAASLVLRAEALRIESQGSATPDGWHGLDGVVADHSFIGREDQVNIVLDVGPRLTVPDPQRRRIPRGERVRIAYQPTDVHVIVGPS